MLQIISAGRGQLNQDQRACLIKFILIRELQNSIQVIMLFMIFFKEEVLNEPNLKQTVVILFCFKGTATIWFWVGMCLLVHDLQVIHPFLRTDIVHFWKLCGSYLHMWDAFWMCFTLKWVLNILHCNSYAKCFTEFSWCLHFMFTTKWNHIFIGRNYTWICRREHKVLPEGYFLLPCHVYCRQSYTDINT